MKTLMTAITSLALFGSVAAPVAFASDTMQKYTPIRPVSECLDLQRINQTYVVDAKTVIANNGPKYFRINLSTDCPNLNVGSIHFQTRNTDNGMLRMCGEVGDKIVTRDGLPCSVQSVEHISHEQYKRLEEASRSHKS